MQMNLLVIHTENHKQGSFNISSACMTAIDDQPLNVCTQQYR